MEISLVFSRFSCGVCCVLHTSAEQMRKREREREGGRPERRNLAKVDCSQSTETIYPASKVANCECWHSVIPSISDFTQLIETFVCPIRSHFLLNSEVRWRSDFITVRGVCVCVNFLYLLFCLYRLSMSLPPIKVPNEIVLRSQITDCHGNIAASLYLCKTAQHPPLNCHTAATTADLTSEHV